MPNHSSISHEVAPVDVHGIAIHGYLLAPDVEAVRGVLREWLGEDPRVRAGVGGQDLVCEDARISLHCCGASDSMFLLQGEVTGEPAATREWLERLKALCAERGLPCLVEGVGHRHVHLRAFLERAFPPDWTPRDESVELRLDRCAGDMSAEARRAVAEDIERVVARAPEQGGCDHVLRVELGSRHVPRRRDGGARQWLLRLRRTLVRREGHAL
ncbi:hypothetical protein [Nannocystis pusilla]|uniref:hypothetical protein n=1 Tax=Nannocystis pusilla TaxID=889268 RepID=UPI003BF17D6D